jgi:erythronate-4-phosphate dehydrogenase
MQIIADENIPHIAEAAETLGTVKALPGRKITRADLGDARCLFVRSVTHVDRDLLEGTPVEFVGSATIGVDHVDTRYLKEAGIAFASAPGSNADSVAEYVVSVLLTLMARRGHRLREQCLGVVGVGNVGSRVAARAEALGMRVILNDPPRERTEESEGWTGLPELLAAADAVSVHVPLTREGTNPTWRMAGAEWFEAMRTGATFINTSRGDVCDEAALRHALETGNLGAAALDVWQNEPAIDPDLLRRVDLGTPHIAGYAYDGKVRGAGMIVNAARKHFGVDQEWDWRSVLPAADVPALSISTAARKELDVLREAVTAVYDVSADDLQLREMLGMEPPDRPVHFDRLRRDYPRRRESANTTITLEPFDEGLARALRGIGFRVDGAA